MQSAWLLFRQVAVLYILALLPSVTQHREQTPSVCPVSGDTELLLVRSLLVFAPHTVVTWISKMRQVK